MDLFLTLLGSFLLGSAVVELLKILFTLCSAFLFLSAPYYPDGYSHPPAGTAHRSWWQNIGEKERAQAREKRRRLARIRTAQRPYDQARSDENIAYWRAQLQQQNVAPKP